MAEEKEKNDLENKKQTTEGEEKKVDENAGKLRQWKQRMNDMKTKSREDYVTYYKTINKKNDVVAPKEQVIIPISDSFVHYYLTLGNHS